MVAEAVLPASTLDPNTHAAPRERATGLTTPWAATMALAGLIALHALYAFVYRVDSDEPQHLHVVWGVARGLLQYRDIFDNHSPLFQMLCAPLMALIGEHAWIVVPMRLAMLPLYAADLALIYFIGGTVYVRRWALWIAVIAGCYPAFFLVTTEFRTDDLWTTLFLAAFYLTVSGPLVGRRAFLFGLVCGACFAVSIKTSLLMLSMGTAGLGLLALHALSRRKIDWMALLKSGGIITAGLVIIPGLVIAYFAAHGHEALRSMYYCIIAHNMVPGLGKEAKAGFHQWIFPIFLPLLLGLGWVCMHSSGKERIGACRALIAMTAGAYYLLLRSYWPLVTAQDFTPFIPLVALTMLPFLFHLLSLTSLPERIAIPAIGLLILAVEGACIWRLQSPLDNREAEFEQDLAVVLRLTNPTDYVMDGKGETIFRMRPVYWVYEGVTLRWMALGKIPDDVKEKMIKTRTCVALNHRLRPEDQAWLRENYIEGNLKVWVAGQSLGPARPAIGFHTDIEANYSIVSDHGKVAGTLDGAPLRDTQLIAPGNHRLAIASGQGNVAVVWTQALNRGFSPFSKSVAAASDQEF